VETSGGGPANHITLILTTKIKIGRLGGSRSNAVNPRGKNQKEENPNSDEGTPSTTKPGSTRRGLASEPVVNRRANRWERGLICAGRATGDNGRKKVSTEGSISIYNAQNGARV